MRRTAILALTVAVLALTALAGCGVIRGESGRELQPPKPGETAPPRRTSSTLAPTTTRAGLSLSSSAVAPGAKLPSEYSCDGAGVSPALSWSGVPAGTTSMALLVTDQEEGGAVQWLVVDLPARAGSTTKGTPPTGGVELPNSFGSKGWKAPCPTSGTHTYEFTLLTFSAPPTYDADADPRAIANALQQAASNTAVFTARFSRDAPSSAGN
jgi:hypothetical protein